MGSAKHSSDEYLLYLNRMIEELVAYGIKDERIFSAMKKVPRHMFLDPSLSLEEAYGDHPLQIKSGQTISQPFTVAFMLEALNLKEGQRVLEIGTGSGWNAALIKQIVGKGSVFSVEYLPELAEFAKGNLKKLGINVGVVNSDGSLGYPVNAPYDRIIITAACPTIPLPIVEQLKEGGVVVAPVGLFTQDMIKGVKIRSEYKNHLKTQKLGTFRFVPLKGKHGFGEEFY
jgi:protein-L-isoaspartate(D-aspartate) O-methyltransferase